MELDKKIKTSSQGVGVWEHYTMRDGLPDMKIECVFEDSRGLLWIGTHDRGVVTYDGHGFHAYTRKDGLVGDAVFSVIEDEDSSIWLGTNMGLSRYDGHKFETVAMVNPQRFSWGSCRDHEGNLWFGIEGVPGDQPKVYTWNNNCLNEILLGEAVEDYGQSINDIQVGDDGKIWFGGYGLFLLQGTKVNKVIEYSSEIGRISSILTMDDGSLWFSAEKGIYVYREIDGIQLLNEVGENGLKGIVSMTKDASGRVWVSSNLGFLYCISDDGISEVCRMSASFWLGRCCDSMGRLWIGTYGMGLYCYDETRFKSYNTDHGLPSNKINCLAEYGGDFLYVGTAGGLVKYNSDSFTIIETPINRNSNIASLFVDSKSTVWFGGYWGALLQMESNGNWNIIRGQDNDCRQVNNVIEDHLGRIWFSSNLGDGFGYYFNGQIHLFPHDQKAEYPTWIGAMEVGYDGKIWIGSSSIAAWDGLCWYEGDVFTRLKGLEGAPVLALFADRDQEMWIGTNEGVSKYDGAQMVHFNQEDGLSCDIITSICQRDDGVIFIGTEGGGICCYDGQVFQVLQIPNEPGLNVIHEVIVDASGIVWAATENGLIQYKSKKVRPHVVIESVVAGSEYDGSHEVSFISSIGRVSFHFQGRSPQERSSYLIYRYCLEGFDEGWRQTPDNQVDYPQLEPGEYALKVQAVDRDLNYSEPAEVKVTVTEDLRIAGLNEALRSASGSGDFIGESPTIRQIKRQVKEVAWTDLTVLILGETGTGKGLAVRAIHEMSDRRDKPFLQVNCGSVQRELFDSELFGHERGAFTGALARKLGKFELADKGTIFLDEIGDLPLESQTRLLHVLQEQTIERVGGTQPINIDVRVIAATNRNLTQAVRQGAFREDLYYRLNVIPIEIPPLRERKEDIPLLAKYFVRQFAAHLHQQQPFIHELALQQLVGYNWPGNVRELEHTLQRAVILAREGSIMPEHIALGPGEVLPVVDQGAFSPIMPLDEYEKLYLERVLEQTGGVIHGKKGAAYLLGMKPTTLRSRLDRLGVEYRKAMI